MKTTIIITTMMRDYGNKKQQNNNISKLKSITIIKFLINMKVVDKNIKIIRVNN